MVAIERRDGGSRLTRHKAYAGPGGQSNAVGPDAVRASVDPATRSRTVRMLDAASVRDDPNKPKLHGPLDAVRCRERGRMIAHVHDPAGYSRVSRDHRLRKQRKIASPESELEDTCAQRDELYSGVARQ
jgi:hypothetical protein